MTTTEELVVSDNSEQQIENAKQEEQNLQKEVSEPETTQKTAVTNVNSFAEDEIPQKFKNKDGSVNVASLVKSYRELEPLINEKADWAKEKENLTSQLFQLQSSSKKENSELSKMSVDFYEKMLEKSSDTEKAKNLIEKYKENPSEELVDELESLFPKEVLKEAYAYSTGIAQKVEQMQRQQLFESEFKDAENYLAKIIEKNKEVFNNSVISELFAEAFVQFGSAFDANWFFGKIEDLKKSFILEYQQLQNAEVENNSALLNASKLSPSNRHNGGTPLSQRNALDLTPQELDKMLDEFNSKH